MSGTVQSVERAFAVLEAFDEDHPARSAADIAESTGLTRPTTYRLLQTLQHLGYVRSSNGRYEVTPRVLRLGAGYLGRRSLAARSQPILDRLSEETGEQTGVAVLDGSDVITVAASRPRQSRVLSVTVEVGQRLPAEATALGRVILAFRPGHGDDPELASIRERGYEVIDGMLESGLRAIGVPIVDHTGVAIASMAIAVNAGRVSIAELEQRCLPGLRRAAALLSDQITPDTVGTP